MNAMQESREAISVNLNFDIAVFTMYKHNFSYVAPTKIKYQRELKVPMGDFKNRSKIAHLLTIINRHN